MKDIDLALLTGVDIPIPECQLTLHQPTIEEISMIGEKQFLAGAQVLCITKEELEDKTGRQPALINTPNFKIFITIMTSKEVKDAKNAVKDALSILVPNATVTFTPRSLLLNYNGTNINIDEGNFEYFQNVLRRVCCLKRDAEEDYNPSNDAARKIAEKMKAAHKRVARIKGDDQGSIYSIYCSSLAIGLHLPLQDFFKCTIYQLNDLLERFNLWTNWDIDIRARLAGATAKGKPEDWMRNIHKDQL